MSSLYEYILRKHSISISHLQVIHSVNQYHHWSTSSVLCLAFYWQKFLLIYQLLLQTVCKTFPQQTEVYLEPSQIYVMKLLNCFHKKVNYFHQRAPSQIFNWVLSNGFASQHYCNSNIISCVFKTTMEHLSKNN